MSHPVDSIDITAYGQNMDVLLWWAMSALLYYLLTGCMRAWAEILQSMPRGAASSTELSSTSIDCRNSRDDTPPITVGRPSISAIPVVIISRKGSLTDDVQCTVDAFRNVMRVAHEDIKCIRLTL